MGNMDPEQEAELRKRLGIPPTAPITFIDMDKTKTVDTNLHGWSDEMIKAKPIEEIEAQVAARESAVAQLQSTVDNERGEIHKLRDVLARKRLLGD